MSEELRKYVADAGLDFESLSNLEKLQAKKDLEELKIKSSSQAQPTVFSLPPQQDFHIAFSASSTQTKFRLKIAKNLRRIFGRTIFVRFGGYVDRINSDSAILATYEVHIWTRANATGIQFDHRFEALFAFIVGLLGISTNEILIDQEPPSEPWLKERFIIIKTESEPQKWSQYEPEEFDDDESVVSIHSHLH